MSPAQIVAAEQANAQLLTQYLGSSMGGYNPQTLTASLQEGNVSTSELNDRLTAVQAEVSQYHPAVAQQISNQVIDRRELPQR